MSTIIMTACWPLQGMSAAQKAVLISLADQANDEGVCWPSLESISRRTCLSERAVRNALRWLQSVKLIACIYRPNQSSYYTVTPARFCQPANGTAGGNAAQNRGQEMPQGHEMPPRHEMPQGHQIPLRGARDAPPGGHQMPPNRKGTINEPSLISTSNDVDGATHVPPTASHTDTCPHQAIIDIYHEMLPTGIRVKAWTAARQQALRARWREDPSRQNLDWWRNFFAYIAESDFLMGRTASHNRHPFEFSLDWLCKAANFIKVLEGRYENRVGGEA